MIAATYKCRSRVAKSAIRLLLILIRAAQDATGTCIRIPRTYCYRNHRKLHKCHSTQGSDPPILAPRGLTGKRAVFSVSREYIVLSGIHPRMWLNVTVK
jgi:hypothetical protein